MEDWLLHETSHPLKIKNLPTLLTYLHNEQQSKQLSLPRQETLYTASSTRGGNKHVCSNSNPELTVKFSPNFLSCTLVCWFLRKKDKKGQAVYKIRRLVESAAFFWDPWQEYINQIEMIQYRVVRYMFNDYNLRRSRASRRKPV